ncbi:hypothetical protein HanIR_Chr14g0703071 [Helianthus annuus]|nr:hypothetical protein HanIR_Chr14g0703071 [Helianthus annuus]
MAVVCRRFRKKVFDWKLSIHFSFLSHITHTHSSWYKIVCTWYNSLSIMVPTIMHKYVVS